MNAEVLVRDVVNRNMTWEEAIKQLKIFWTDEETGISSKPEWWWNLPKDQTKSRQIKMGMEEAARKYFSVKEYLKHGTPNVCTPPEIRDGDDKFGDSDILWLWL